MRKAVLVVVVLFSQICFAKEKDYILSMGNNLKWEVDNPNGCETLLVVGGVKNGKILLNSIVEFYDNAIVVYDSKVESRNDEIRDSKKEFSFVVKNHIMYLLDDKGREVPVKFKFWNEGRKTFIVFESSLFSGKYKVAESEN